METKHLEKNYSTSSSSFILFNFHYNSLLGFSFFLKFWWFVQDCFVLSIYWDLFFPYELSKLLQIEI